jgi:PEP-CTERM motif
MKWIAGAGAAIAVMSLASAAGAVTLGTGVGSLGSPEPNWALTSSPGSTSLTIVSGAQDYPGAWVVAPAGSNWITPYAGGGTTATSEAPVGEYDYSLTFSNPMGSVAVQWSSDNGAEFFLNNVSLSTVGPTGYGSLASFLIPAATFLGSNTFLVKVQNDPCDCNNPTGLLVSADVAATPLPSALPLFASGLGALGLLGWRRKRKAAALAA